MSWQEKGEGRWKETSSDAPTFARSEHKLISRYIALKVSRYTRHLYRTGFPDPTDPKGTPTPTRGNPYPESG